MKIAILDDNDKAIAVHRLGPDAAIRPIASELFPARTPADTAEAILSHLIVTLITHMHGTLRATRVAPAKKAAEDGADADLAGALD